MNDNTLHLTLKRVALNKAYTIGHLYIDDKYFCDTLEDTVRDINKDGKFDNGEVKIPGKTAIPYGEYRIDMNTVSPRFSKIAQYNFCKGKLPRLIGIFDFIGVLIHVGNTVNDTDGCILVGQNKIKGQVVNSMATFRMLYDILEKANLSGKIIMIKII